MIRTPQQQKKGMATVYARIAVNGRRSEISLKKKVAPKDWDEAKGKAKGKREKIQKLNSHIERVRTLIADAYHELVQQRKTVHVDAVKSLFLGTAEGTVTLRKLVEYHNRETAHKLAQGTLKNYYTTQRDTYFKTRRPFSRRKHRYDIGSPIGFWNYYDDNHFLTRLYVIGNEEQEQCYNYHMEYAVSTGKCTEAEFYAHVREIVADHIEAIRKESPFSCKHGRNRVNLKYLRTFRDYLVSINTYGYRDPVDITITRYDMEIASLKKELAKKNKELEELKIYEK